jgi:hypothetical protein
MRPSVGRIESGVDRRYDGEIHSNSTIYDVASHGLFSDNIDTDAAEPVLLNARDNSVVYRTPTVLANGTLSVKGLESKSGATGADGPTFMFVP